MNLAGFPYGEEVCTSGTDQVSLQYLPIMFGLYLADFVALRYLWYAFQ